MPENTKPLDSDQRPWGSYQVLAEIPNYKIKHIIVKPHSKLSYQSHQYRQENWTVIQGQGTVIIDDQEQIVLPNQSIFIPQGAKHRLINTQESPCEIIEIQTGSYFGEDDITRYEDEYGRS